MNRLIKFRVWQKYSGKILDNDWLMAAGPLYNAMFDAARTDISLMQWTGLVDKNGKEIYEGDIVECHDHPTGVDDTLGPVIFEHGHYKVNGYALHDYGTAWTEVKGNIHQNTKP